LFNDDGLFDSFYSAATAEDPAVDVGPSLMMAPEFGDWSSSLSRTGDSASPKPVASCGHVELSPQSVVQPSLLKPSPSKQVKRESHISPLSTTRIAPLSSGVVHSQLGKHQRHKNSAARCRERLHALLENLWETVPEEERNRLSRRAGGEVGELSRADKIGIVVFYIRNLKSELNER
jgi:hypothetical protein